MFINYYLFNINTIFLSLPLMSIIWKCPVYVPQWLKSSVSSVTKLFTWLHAKLISAASKTANQSNSSCINLGKFFSRNRHWSHITDRLFYQKRRLSLTLYIRLKTLKRSTGINEHVNKSELLLLFMKAKNCM